MTASDNPFTLFFGKQPLQYIDRLSQTDSVINTFESDDPSTQVYLVTGVRGSGKNVMMTSIANDLDKRGKWIVVNLNPTRDMLHALAAKLYKEPLFKPLLAELKVDFSLLGIGVSIARSNKISNIESVIEILLGIAKRLDKTEINTNMFLLQRWIWTSTRDFCRMRTGFLRQKTEKALRPWQSMFIRWG